MCVCVYLPAWGLFAHAKFHRGRKGAPGVTKHGRGNIPIFPLLPLGNATGHWIINGGFSENFFNELISWYWNRVTSTSRLQHSLYSGNNITIRPLNYPLKYMRICFANHKFAVCKERMIHFSFTEATTDLNRLPCEFIIHNQCHWLFMILTGWK